VAVAFFAAGPTSAAGLFLEVGLEPVTVVGEGPNFAGLGVRGSLALDLGIVEPAFIAFWVPGSDPGAPNPTRQQGGLLLHSFAGMLRVHTPAPHQLGLGIGFGSGTLQAAQIEGFGTMDDPAGAAHGYRGRPGGYGIGEISYGYDTGPFRLGIALTGHLFSHADFLSVPSSLRTPPSSVSRESVGPFVFFGLLASVGVHLADFSF